MSNEPPHQPAEIGLHFGGGRYHLLSELGRGGQGSVYLARDTTLDRKVALKLLTGAAFRSPGVNERFKREAMVASRLDHPGICTVYDWGEEAEVPYIVMRYVEGVTLSTAITESELMSADEPSTGSVFLDLGGGDDDGDESQGGDTLILTADTATVGRAEIDRRLHFFERTAEALHVAHEAGVVHRDIKPGNIMITREGRPVILDFGLARTDDDSMPTLTQSREVFGTPSYMSPEQVGGTVQVDRRTDIYSLGVSLYEALTQRRPFAAPTREKLFNAIMWKRAADPRSLNRAISRDLAVVIATAMEKDRDRRYLTARDFADELRRVQRNEPVLARPVGPLVLFRRWFVRNPALAASVCFAFLSLTVGVVVSLLLADSYREARDEADHKTAEVLRLSDAKRVDDLLRRARVSLWPCRPEMIHELRGWLREARAVVGRLPRHRATLESMKTRAEPYAAADDRAA